MTVHYVHVYTCVERKEKEGGEREREGEGGERAHLRRHDFDISDVASEFNHRLHLSNGRLYRFINQIWPIQNQL